MCFLRVCIVNKRMSSTILSHQAQKLSCSANPSYRQMLSLCGLPIDFWTKWWNILKYFIGPPLRLELIWDPKEKCQCHWEGNEVVKSFFAHISIKGGSICVKLRPRHSTHIVKYNSPPEMLDFVIFVRKYPRERHVAAVTLPCTRLILRLTLTSDDDDGRTSPAAVYIRWNQMYDDQLQSHHHKLAVAAAVSL